MDLLLLRMLLRVKILRIKDVALVEPFARYIQIQLYAIGPFQPLLRSKSR